MGSPFSQSSSPEGFPFLRNRVAAEIRRLKPDVLFATGDYVTRPRDDITEVTRWVADLPAHNGVLTP